MNQKISEELLSRIEEVVCEMVDQRFMPSQKALQEIEEGHDEEDDLYYRELADFTRSVVMVLHDRINKKYRG